MAQQWEAATCSLQLVPPPTVTGNHFIITPTESCCCLTLYTLCIRPPGYPGVDKLLCTCSRSPPPVAAHAGYPGSSSVEYWVCTGREVTQVWWSGLVSFDFIVLYIFVVRPLRAPFHSATGPIGNSPESSNMFKSFVLSAWCCIVYLDGQWPRTFSQDAKIVN